MTNDAITSVIAASASATGKVFVIGAIGYISAIRPRPVPILPPHAMNAISKMNFNLVSLHGFTHEIYTLNHLCTIAHKKSHSTAYFTLSVFDIGISCNS